MITDQSSDVSRSRVLRGQFHKKPDAIYPPWSFTSGSNFFARCTRCGQCAEACPEGIISADRDGLPVVKFSDGECTFCGECAEKCMEGALVHTTDEAPWSLKASVTANCLSVQGVMCRACMENCEPQSITFRLATKGRSLPVIDEASCTGCGACVAPCVANAIVMQGAIP